VKFNLQEEDSHQSARGGDENGSRSFGGNSGPKSTTSSRASRLSQKAKNRQRVKARAAGISLEDIDDASSDEAN